eukprot:CAMPEP_0181452488 /NCGR_PEP_ID=MMETSP1110-20121109/29231_1 /TAXON_ID=174948 /ORGANISM="Symbiodinium sp., Strain CCMP421" /LENGTH=242 /DNA_ID=CAMNT_0023576769 /DNA_START=158 /DNA_END=887 /DNA_ORIENTATION=-
MSPIQRGNLSALRSQRAPLTGGSGQRLVALAQVMGALDRSEDEVVVVDARRRMGEVQVVVGPIVIRLPGPLRAPALVPVVGAQIGHHNDDLLRSEAALLQRLQVGMTPQTISRVEEAALRTAEAAKPMRAAAAARAGAPAAAVPHGLRRCHAVVGQACCQLASVHSAARGGLCIAVPRRCSEGLIACIAKSIGCSSAVCFQQRRGEVRGVPHVRLRGVLEGGILWRPESRGSEAEETEGQSG